MKGKEQSYKIGIDFQYRTDNKLALLILVHTFIQEPLSSSNKENNSDICKLSLRDLIE